MGSFRLALAVLVALSHAGVRVAGYNPGVVAVVGFFLLSGYVMTALIERNYRDSSRVGLFYLDRLGRIYPQFALYLGVALLFALALGPAAVGAPKLDASTLLGNVLLVPLNFFQYGDLGQALLLAPAWSLGLEVLFYLVMPWLLICKVRGAAFAVSIGVYALAFFGVLNADAWAYRLLPGTLFIFLLGSYMRTGGARVLVGTWAACLAALVCIASLPLDRAFMAEVLAGILLGVPLVWALSRRRWGRLDATLGDVSYGLFLSHWPLLMAARALGWPIDTAGQLAGWLALSALLAVASYHAVEKPLLAWRRALRSQRPAVGATASAE